jgi:glutamate racemase
VEVFEHATPELVPLVEAGRLQGPAVEAALRRSLAPLISGVTAVPSEDDPAFVFPKPPDARIDTLLLGCTHYPLLAPLVRSIVGEEVAVIDSATATASALAGLIEVHALGTPDPEPGRHLMLTTGDTAAFAATATRLFGPDLGLIEGIALGKVPAAEPV